MSEHVTIEDLEQKLALMLRSDRTSVRSWEMLRQKLGIGKDYLSRIRSGTRVLTEENFLKLCEVFNVSQREWFSSLTEFGHRLGFSSRQIGLITGTPIPGIDFSSRINDERTVSDIFNIIEGYWESFYFSVSKTDRQAVCRDLLVVKRVNEDNFIECEVHDYVFVYKGWCFPIRNHLYLVLEKAGLFNEIIVYATNLPDRQPPRLYGVILCLSGGVDEVHSFPCAAKVAFRYMGKETDIREKFGLTSDADVYQYVTKKLPKYLHPDDPSNDEDTLNILRDISNILPADAIPAALRMTK